MLVSGLNKNVAYFSLFLNTIMFTRFIYIPSNYFRWLTHIDGQPGFSEEAFDCLSRTCSESRDGEIEVALIVDAMGIRKHVSWDPKRQCFVGYVDYGAESNTEYVASEALVFLVVGIYANWKEPIAYFLTNGISGFNLSQLLKETLERLHDIVVNVVIGPTYP